MSDWCDEDLCAWPQWMPLPQTSSYSYEPTDRRTRTDMEVGSVIRVNYDTDETTVNCTLILDRVQSAWFETFERDLDSQGAGWFRMPLLIGGCLSWHTVRFSSRPQAGDIIGLHMTYTFTLDVQQRNLPMCAELAALLLCISWKDFLDAYQCTRTFVLNIPNFRLPADEMTALSESLDYSG